MVRLLMLVQLQHLLITCELGHLDAWIRSTIVIKDPRTLTVLMTGYLSILIVTQRQIYQKKALAVLCMFVLWGIRLSLGPSAVAILRSVLFTSNTMCTSITLATLYVRYATYILLNFSIFYIRIWL